MDEIVVFNAEQARLNITINGQNGDYPDPIRYDANDGDIKQIASEAVRTGYVPGIQSDPNVNFQDFVVDRFPATNELPPRIMLRPKTPFGMELTMGEVITVEQLHRGDVVQALEDLKAANVKRGTLGVVFEEFNNYKDQGGPMVRWMNMNCCNVYNNQVMFVRR
jgi:hypothetical protein